MPQNRVDGLKKQPSNWNLPNALTVLRILGVPLFLWLLVADSGDSIALRWWAFATFSLLMLTDKLDGHLARSRNLITKFGQVADPIADKSLMIAALVGLNIIGALPVWVTVIILIRELGITIWRMVLLRSGSVVPASQGGKLKTVLQSVAVAMFIAPLALQSGSWWLWPCWIVMLAAIVVTVATGIQYLVDSKKKN